MEPEALVRLHLGKASGLEWPACCVSGMPTSSLSTEPNPCLCTTSLAFPLLIPSLAYPSLKLTGRTQSSQVCGTVSSRRHMLLMSTCRSACPTSRISS